MDLINWYKQAIRSVVGRSDRKAGVQVEFSLGSITNYKWLFMVSPCTTRYFPTPMRYVRICRKQVNYIHVSGLSNTDSPFSPTNLCDAQYAVRTLGSTLKPLMGLKFQSSITLHFESGWQFKGRQWHTFPLNVYYLNHGTFWVKVTN